MEMGTKILEKYEVRIEEIGSDQGKPIIMVSYYNSDGKYIGDAETFDRLVVKKGIDPITHDDCNVCCIGKSRKDDKWYGWSHRAINGFEIGDTVKEGDCCASSGYTKEYLAEHPEENKALSIGFEAKTEKDCKIMATAFAESVG